MLLAFRIVALGIGPTLRGEIMEMLLLARAKHLLDRVSNNVKYPTLDGSPALPAEAAALIECLRNLGLVEDADAMRKDFIVHFAHETRLPNTGLDPRFVEFRSKANELFGPFLKYSRPEGDGTVVRLRLIDHFDGLRITVKKLSMLSSPLTPPQTAFNTITTTTAAGPQSDVPDNGPTKPVCYVTLMQMASIVNKSKSTLEKLKSSGVLPEPAIRGGAGKADEWEWNTIRPILEREYARQLPAIFPADRFVRR